MPGPREYFVIAVKRGERARFLIWCGADRDGLLISEGGELRVFASDAEARAHAVRAGLRVSASESAYFDLDELEAWIAAPNPFRLRPDELLNAWNLLGDVARAVGNEVAEARLLDRRDLALYDRLFRCCDLPATGLEGSGRPSAEDCAEIAGVLRHGLAGFDAALSLLPAPAPR